MQKYTYNCKSDYDRMLNPVDLSFLIFPFITIYFLALYTNKKILVFLDASCDCAVCLLVMWCISSMTHFENSLFHLLNKKGMYMVMCFQLKGNDTAETKPEK